VTEDNVYLTAGAAMPSVIETIFLSLMNETFEAAYRLLLKVSSHDVSFVSAVLSICVLSAPLSDT
jgi:hypothetical protein